MFVRNPILHLKIIKSIFLIVLILLNYSLLCVHLCVCLFAGLCLHQAGVAVCCFPWQIPQVDSFIAFPVFFCPTLARRRTCSNTRRGESWLSDLACSFVPDTPAQFTTSHAEARTPTHKRCSVPQTGKHLQNLQTAQATRSSVPMRARVGERNRKRYCLEVNEKIKDLKKKSVFSSAALPLLSYLPLICLSFRSHTSLFPQPPIFSSLLSRCQSPIHTLTVCSPIILIYLSMTASFFTSVLSNAHTKSNDFSLYFSG